MMRSILALALVGATALPAAATQNVLDEMLSVLAGSHTEGRAIDTDLDEAADEIVRVLGMFDLDVVEQEFEGPDGHRLRNLLGIVEGTDPEAGWIVVGAHYDHLGLGEPGTPNHGTVHPGADDNASGCAVLASVYEQWEPTERGVVFAWFTAEEIGLLGSKHFVENPPEGVDEIVAMVNLDTVGRLADGGLTVFGVESAPAFEPALRGIDTAFGLDLETVARSSGTADDMAFAERAIPTLHLFTGAHATYHRPGDTLEKLDRAGLGTLVDFTYELVDYLARPDADLQFVPAGAQEALADPERATEGRRRVSLGTIPDFQGGDGGVELTGVLPDSPAAEAGLQEGDVIVGFGGAPVDDLTDYSEALKRYEPGDTVDVEFLRDGDRRSVTVTLVARR
jgi:hypothetical protein